MVSLGGSKKEESGDTGLYIASGVLGAAVGVALILLFVLYMYVKHVEKKLTRMIESGSGGGGGETSFLPRIESPPKSFGQGSQFGGTPSFHGGDGFPGKPNPAQPVRNPFNRQDQSMGAQPWLNEQQGGGGGGGYGFGKPAPQRPGGPGPQRPARMGY